MEIRLVQLLGSFIATTSEYTLARLDFAMRHPTLPSPPVVDRLSDASELTLAIEWDRIERQLEEAQCYLRRVEDPRGKRAVYDRSFATLRRTVRELEQY